MKTGICRESMAMRILPLLSVLLASCIASLAQTQKAVARQDANPHFPKGAVGVIAWQRYLPYFIHPALKQELRDAGYSIGELSGLNLQEKELRQFNALILLRPPTEARASDVELFKKQIPWLKNYLAAGGGMLMFADSTVESQTQELGCWNTLLASSGGQFLNEQIIDPDTMWRQKSFVRYLFADTTNIPQDAELTNGVKLISYGLGHGLADRKAMPLKVDSSWTVLIKGNTNAFSADTDFGNKDWKAAKNAPGTYNSEPVIAASREWLGGRLVLFGNHSTFWVQEAYHPVWEDIALKKGDGKKFLLNALDWLIKPSLSQRALGGYIAKEKQIDYTLSTCKVINWSDFITALKASERSPSSTPAQFVWHQLSDGTRNVLSALPANNIPGEEAKRTVVKEINEKVLKKSDFLQGKDDLWRGVTLGAETAALRDTTRQASPLSNQEITHVNRLLLNAAFPGMLAPPETEFKSVYSRRAEYVNELPPDKALPLPIFKGVIGLHSDLSDGDSSFAALVAAAQSKGYDYVAFCESFARMDLTKYTKLAALCQEATTDTFAAFPGIEFMSAKGERRCALALAPGYWPAGKMLDESGAKIRDLPGLEFHNLPWPPIFLIAPGKSPIPPAMCKFMGGTALVTYDHNQLTDKIFDDYMLIQSTGFNQHPVAYQGIYSVKELTEYDGALTYVRSPSPGKILEEMRYWQGNRNLFVSAGPIIEKFSIDNGPGSTREEYWRLHIKARSTNGIEEVTLYDNTGVSRIFKPGSARFEIELLGRHDRQHHFFIVVKDTKGLTATSAARATADYRQANYMCTDMQNTIASSFQRGEDGDIHMAGTMGTHVTGWSEHTPGITFSEQLMIPSGLDYISGTFKADVHTKLAFPKGERPISYFKFPFNCGDCNIMDRVLEYKFLPGSIVTPTEIISGSSRITLFTPRVKGYNLHHVDNHVRFLKDMTIPAGDKRLPLTFMEITGNAESMTNYTVLARDGQCHTGSFADAKDWPRKYKIAKGGFVAMWPDFYGAPAIYPLDGQEYDVELSPGRIVVGMECGGKQFKSGDELRSTLLLARDKYLSKTDASFKELSASLGLGSAPCHVDMQTGDVLDTVWALRMNSQNGQVAGKISPARLPFDQPMIIEGLHDNVSAFLWDKSKKYLRRIGVGMGKGFLAENLDNGLSFVAGHAVQIDRQELLLNVIDADKRRLWFEVHNPTSEVIKARVWVESAFYEVLPEYSEETSVNPGSSTFIKKEF